MIIKTTLTAKNYKATLEPKLKLYKGDIVIIEFTLINSILSSINDVVVEESLPLNALTDVKLKLLTPTGNETIESVEIIDNKARFKMQVSEDIGDYNFQLVCYDEDGCIFHLPPCTYTIEDTIG